MGQRAAVAFVEGTRGRLRVRIEMRSGAHRHEMDVYAVRVAQYSYGPITTELTTTDMHEALDTFMDLVDPMDGWPPMGRD